MQILYICGGVAAAAVRFPSVAFSALRILIELKVFHALARTTRSRRVNLPARAMTTTDGPRDDDDAPSSRIMHFNNNIMGCGAITTAFIAPRARRRPLRCRWLGWKMCVTDTRTRKVRRRVGRV